MEKKRWLHSLLLACFRQRRSWDASAVRFVEKGRQKKLPLSFLTACFQLRRSWDASIIRLIEKDQQRKWPVLYIVGVSFLFLILMWLFESRCSMSCLFEAHCYCF